MKRKNEFGNRSEEVCVVDAAGYAADTKYCSQTLAKLQKFTESIRASKKSHTSTGGSAACAAAESYHGQVLQADGSGDELDDTADWHHGKLKFKKHIDDKYRLNGDNAESFSVLDPRAGGR